MKRVRKMLASLATLPPWAHRIGLKLTVACIVACAPFIKWEPARRVTLVIAQVLSESAEDLKRDEPGAKDGGAP
jgi:hypothetical protein